MRRAVIGGWMATALLVASATVAMAQSSTPPPWADELPDTFVGHGRVDRPTDPFSITFPEDWEVFEVTPEDRQPGVEHELVALDPVDMEGCSLQLMDSAGLSGDRLERYVRRRSQDEPGLHEPRILQLANGRVLQVDADVTDPILGTLELTRYAFDDLSNFAILECFSGSDRPDDAWLSIAESLEFLPVIE